MARTWTAALVVLISTAVHAQTDAPRRYVVIGCINRQTAAERGGGVPAEHGRGAGAPGVNNVRGVGVPAQPGRGADAPGSNLPFVLTDTRRDPPAVYRLDGDAKQLAFLVGQTVEIAGPVTSGGDKQPATLKVTSLTRIATTCMKAR